MKKAIATALVVIALGVNGSECTEDAWSLCWDGRTMGNRITREWHEPTGTYHLIRWFQHGSIRLETE